MRPLRYSINVTLDGCVDHRVGLPDEQLHKEATATLARNDVLLFGRVIYQMMESAWRAPSSEMPPWTMPFAKTISAAKKVLVSSTIKPNGWNTELLQGDLITEVKKLKEQDGNGILVGGVTLPTALEDAGLIDEYEFIVHPVVSGGGPRLFPGLKQRRVLKLVEKLDYTSGAVRLRYTR